MAQVKIEVYGGMNAAGGGCSCGCSSCSPSDVRSEYEAMKKNLLDQFGADNLTIEYIDTEAAGLSNYPAVEEVIKAGYPFPITVINDKPRWAGGMAADSIVQIVIDAINAN